MPEKKFAKPVSDEIGIFWAVSTGGPTQKPLPYGQRTSDSQETFGGDNRNHQEMDYAEPDVTHPLPVQKCADHNERHAQDNHEGVKDVNDQDDVGNQGRGYSVNSSTGHRQRLSICYTC